MQPNDAPPSAKEQRFIQKYVDCRDLAKAAQYAGFDGTDGAKLYSKRKIRVHIDRAIELYDHERAKLAAKASVLHVDFIDAELVKAVKTSATNGTTKIRAIELAYERVGLRRDSNFIIPGSAENSAPNMYQALIQRQTVKTEVTVERSVTQLSGSTPAPALPAAPDEPSTTKPLFEILDY